MKAKIEVLEKKINELKNQIEELTKKKSDSQCWVTFERRNCDVYRTFEDAAVTYINKGNVLYNCLPKYTTFGDFVHWLLSPYIEDNKNK